MTGTNVGTAYLEILPSAKGFAGKLQSQVGGDMTKAGRKAGDAYAGGFSGGLKKLAGAAAGLAVLDKVKDFVGDSIGAASDLNETVNKSTVIFGSNAKAIEAWATSADKSMGLSKQAALDSAASFGDMFSQIGLGRDNATKMSKTVVQLAADLGSFNNLSTEDVLDRLAGGFRGEYDALQKVIPNISAARVQTEALRRTHKKAAKDLTAAEKAQATLAIVQHDGARAAGDFARTSNGLANSQKIQAAEAENLKAKIGSSLLPIQLKFTRFLADDAIPAVSDFVTGMQDGTGAGGDFADVLKDIYGVGKGVVSLFDSLPGPVKKYGIELALAAVVIGKVNSGLGAFSTRVTTYTRSIASAETRSARFATTMQGVGAGLRNVAGAGGMLLLSDSTNRTSESMGTLEAAAGGALTGAALGAFAGPPGAAVGAAIGGLAGAAFSLSQNTEDSGKSAKIAIGSYKDYAQTLDGVAESTTNATRAMVLERLEKSGLLDATRKLGLTDREAVNALTGNIAARRKLSSLLSSSTAITNKQKDALRQETGAVAQSRREQLEHNIAIAGSATELKNARTALKRFMAAPASKRVSITGAEDVITRLKNIRTALNQVFGHGPTEKTSGPGGLSVLLNPEGAGATGAIVRRPTVALIGERGPEALVPLNRTRGNTPLPTGTTGGSSSPQRLYLVLDDGTQVSGYIDNRIGAHSGSAGMIRRAR